MARGQPQNLSSIAPHLAMQSEICLYQQVLPSAVPGRPMICRCHTGLAQDMPDDLLPYTLSQFCRSDV